MASRASPQACLGVFSFPLRGEGRGDCCIPLPPTRPMQEAVPADYCVPEAFPELRFPRLQILTIADLFAGKRLEYPRWVPPKTFKKAPAALKAGPGRRQPELL